MPMVCRRSIPYCDSRFPATYNHREYASQIIDLDAEFRLPIESQYAIPNRSIHITIAASGRGDESISRKCSSEFWEKRLNTNRKLAYAISAILCGCGSASYAATAADTDTTETSAIAEIVVTAQRRNESIQDVPITIQAITGDQLKQLNVSTFDDLLKYTPNVTFSGTAPGTGNIFVRGLSAGSGGNQSSATIAPFPNVAIYLDDQSMQFPGRNLDVYLVDMERVEVLEGPQGTLFGGGAQAGAIRYITNKPKLDVTEGDLNAGYGVTARGGDPNASANATINLPLIPDTLAVRATIFTDHRGGYISNVPSTIANPVQPSVTANNAALVGSNENPVTYTGIRSAALLKFNDDWNLLLQQNYQNLEADGYFSEYPVGSNGAALAPYQITGFTPSYDKDHYESTSWTLNGRFGNLGAFGDLKFVYTGSYLDRHIEQQGEYSNYLRSAGGAYYDCTGNGSGGLGGSTKPLTCYAPVGSWNDAVENTHQSHEIRVSTSDDNRLRGLLGGYWEEFDIKDQQNYNYLVIPQCNANNLAISQAGGPDCVSAVGPIPGYYATDPSLRENSDTAFGEDVERGYRQTAFFTSVDFDLIPKVLTLTGGTRYYHYDEFERGSEFYTSTAANNIPNGACISSGGCGFGINLNKTESGFRSRGNLSWHVTPDFLAYYTYSQGFRPGGFNRTETLANGTVVLTGEAPYTTAKATDQYNKPSGFGSDNLTNNEIGIKSEFLDHRVQVNASAYRMKWSNVQLPLFDPVNLGNTNFVVNGPTYVVKGVELQLIARPMEGLTVQGSSSLNSTNQTNAPCLSSNRDSAGNPTPLGTCITQIKGHPYTNPYGVLDTSPAFSPPLEFNLRARYDWTLRDYKPFVTVGANHIATMRNEPASFPSGTTSALCTPIPTTTLCQYVMPGYTTYDAAIGVAKDNWTAQVTGNNLTNSDASTYTASNQFIEAKTPLRPRVITFLMGYKF
jgi:iron complex outermembrane recepter protein